MSCHSCFSNLYLACETGDIEQVKKICFPPDVEFISINRVEPNGETALHIASSLGHIEIVRFLLEDVGVIRHRINSQSLTAYQMAKNDEVRRLFHRPFDDQLKRYSCSFQDFKTVQADDQDSESDLTFPENEEEIDDIEGYDLPDTYTTGHGGSLGILGEQLHKSFYLKYMNKAWLRVIFMRLGNLIHRLEGEMPLTHSTDTILRQEFQTILDQHITPCHRQYKKACWLVNEYFTVKNIDLLIRLYTMATPFYSNTQKEDNPLEFAILCHIKSLKNRYFKGTVYRGMATTEKYLQMYKRGLKYKPWAITNNTFWSATADPKVANMYMNEQPDTNAINILLIIEFTQRTEMAIRLSAIPELQLPNISEMEDEEEILILPNAIFSVTAIEKSDFSPRAFTIRLENVYIEEFSRRRAFKKGAPDILKLFRRKFQG